MTENNPFEFPDDEFNPFDQPVAPLQTSTDTYDQPNRIEYSASVSSQPATSSVPPIESKKPTMKENVNKAGSATEKFVTSIPGMKITEEELAQREAILARREQEISKRENQIAEAKANGTFDQLQYHPKNFPIILKIWSYYPEDDLPPESIPTVNVIKWIMIASALILVYNFIECFFAYSENARLVITNATTFVLMSALYGAIIIPISFEFCFFVLYNALKLGKGLKFFGFMLMYSLFLLVHGALLVGYSDYGGSFGFIHMVELFSKKASVAGVLGLIYCIFTSLLVVAIILTWLRMFRYYRTSGLDKKTVGEAGKIAADYAYDNREVVVQAARDNPEAAASFAQTSASFAYDL